MHAAGQPENLILVYYIYGVVGMARRRCSSGRTRSMVSGSRTVTNIVVLFTSNLLSSLLAYVAMHARD